jgi:MFS family permease
VTDTRQRARLARLVTAGGPGSASGFRSLLASTGISNLGDGIDVVALPLVAATLTRDPVVFAGVAVAGRLPWLLFALHAGVLVDRLDRRRLMAWMNVMRFALLTLLGVAVVAGWTRMWLLYGVAFVLGIGEALFDTAAQSILPMLVHQEDLERANGRLYAAEIVSNQFAGPPLGGILFGVAASLPILIDAGTFLLSALLILRITGSYAARPSDTGTDESINSEIVVGLRWLWNHRILRTLALMLGLLNGFGMALLAVFPLFAIEVLGLTSTGYGLLFTCLGVGGLLASLMAGKIIDRFGRGAPMALSVLVFGSTTVVQGLASSGVVVGAMAVLYGAAIVVWNVITVSLRQAIVPPYLLGRVNSAYRLLGWGSMPIGSLLGGVLAASFGLRVPFLVAGGVWLVAGLLMLRVVNERTMEDARGSMDQPSVRPA